MSKVSLNGTIPSVDYSTDSLDISTNTSSIYEQSEVEATPAETYEKHKKELGCKCMENEKKSVTKKCSNEVAQRIKISLVKAGMKSLADLLKAMSEVISKESE